MTVDVLANAWLMLERSDIDDMLDCFTLPVYLNVTSVGYFCNVQGLF